MPCFVYIQLYFNSAIVITCCAVLCCASEVFSMNIPRFYPLSRYSTSSLGSILLSKADKDRGRFGFARLLNKKKLGQSICSFSASQSHKFNNDNSIVLARSSRSCGCARRCAFTTHRVRQHCHAVLKRRGRWIKKATLDSDGSKCE